MADAFRTAGVDLASQDNRTALAEIRWQATHAVLESVRVGVGNDAIVDAAGCATLIGIDCPLGWPAAFTDFLVATRSGALPADAGATAAAKQRLAYRHTDIAVRQATGRWPLSVSADRIAYPAMRCAGLLARLDGHGHRVRRSGVGSIVAEVYPAGALLTWQVARAGPKSDRSALAALVDDLVVRTPWLDWADLAPVCGRSHDALDAVICAIVAGAVLLGRTAGPPDGVPADEEGWIHLPDASFLRTGPVSVTDS